MSRPTVRLSHAEAAGLLLPPAARPRSVRPRKRGAKGRHAGPEAALLRQVTDWLTAKNLWWERRNAGVRFVEGRRIRLGAAGTPDLHLMVPGRPSIFVELKAAGGRLRPSQRAWALRAEAAGATVFVVRSLDALIDALEAEGVITR